MFHTKQDTSEKKTKVKGGKQTAPREKKKKGKNRGGLREKSGISTKHRRPRGKLGADIGRQKK